MFLLLVTWFYFNQPPHTTQVSFGTEQACQAARQQMLGEARRLDADREAVIRRDPGYNPVPAPTVSAVCLRR